jgi:peroxiredoxin
LFSPEDTDVVPGAAWKAPDNSWPVGEPPADLLGEGFDPGQVVPDFLMMDQHGADVSMWQFYGHTIALDVSTMWCRPCQELAKHAEDTYQEFKDDGFVHMTLLPQDLGTDTPDLAELNQWVDQFGLTVPVLADQDGEYSNPLVPDNVYPVLVLIGPDMKVIEHIDPATDENLKEAVERSLY